jgi:hypothetical protein
MPHKVAHETLKQLRRLVTVFVAVAVLLFAYTIWQSYQGRLDIRRAQLAACARSKLDRLANAEGWRAAEHARRASGTPNDLEAASRYDVIATGLEKRGHIDCKTAFPPVSLRP